MLYQIQLNHITYGIVVKNRKVTEAPPIARWMIGENFVPICKWIAKKHGKIVKITGEELY